MSPLNVAIPFYEPGHDLTGRASGAAVIGKRCLQIVADQLDTAEHSGVIPVAHAAAGGRICGVADRDAAVDKTLGLIRGPGRVVPIRAEAAIAVFEEVEVGTAGQVIPVDAVARPNSVPIGYALTGAAINTDAKIHLYS